MSSYRIATLLVLAATLAAAACGRDVAGPAPARPVAQASVLPLEPMTFDIGGIQWNECGNAGAGEWLTVSGTVHVDINEVVDASGGLRSSMHVGTSALRGVGQVTGDVYQGRISEHDRTMIRDGADGTSTLRMGTRFIGRGGASDFSYEYFGRVRLTADGGYEVLRDSTRVSCR